MTLDYLLSKLMAYEPADIISRSYQKNVDIAYCSWMLPSDYTVSEVEEILDDFQERYDLPYIPTPQRLRTAASDTVVFDFQVSLPY